MAMQEATRVEVNGSSTEKLNGLATIDLGMHAVEEKLNAVVDSDVTVLRDASRHIIGSGGKRIRPRVTLLSFLACGGEGFQDIVPVAAAVELVHTASVVHDDINDHGTVRRGRPSVNAVWGRTFALLTGDFLFTKVYELMAAHRDLNIPLSEATVALVEGETLQASAVKNNTLNRQVYYDIIARKTAALFRAGARMGAMMTNAAAEIVDALGQYGFNIGLAFQIVDDILDLTADVTKLGKTAGIDLEQGKGFAAAYTAEEAATQEPDPMAKIRSKAMEGKALEEARAQAHMLVQAAIDSLTILPDSDAKTQLIDIARLVVAREF